MSATISSVSVETPLKNITIKTDFKTTIEDLIIEACNILKIGPIARHLFAVRTKFSTTWLPLNAYVQQIPSNTATFVIDTEENARKLQANDRGIFKLIDYVTKRGSNDPDLLVENGILYRKQLEKVVFLPDCVRNKDFELRMRFAVPSPDRLLYIDCNALDFYFNQIRSIILSDELPQSVRDKFRSELNGLSILDMYRVMLEQNFTIEDVMKNYKEYVPWSVKMRNFFFLPGKLRKHLREMVNRNYTYSSFEVKTAYLDQFKIIFPDYFGESFYVTINNVKKPISSANICVNPYHPDFPGITLKYIQDETIERVCKIDDLCCINIRKEGTVEISRKNGIPLYLKFHSTPDMMSFVSFLDGYYRLSVKWTFNLCPDLPTPSLQKLKLLKCHGPICGKFSYSKIKKKRNNKVGCFILRESDQKYDEFYIDVCTKTSFKPLTFKIEMTNKKQYRLSHNDRITYPSILALIAAHKSVLRECLPPSEFDESNLLICQINKPSKCKEIVSATNPLIIHERTLMEVDYKPRESRNQFNAVFKSVWTTYNERKIVAMKMLKENHRDNYLKEFLSLIGHWGFINSNSVVKLFGVKLSDPVSMVTEYLPLGRLDHYLQNVDNHIPVKEVDLVEAAAYLANALWHMDEARFVHGNIRCRKILVSSHTRNSFTIKLSDPGLHDSYTDADLHWIPPEYHNERLNEARKSVMADVWAFGTTVWEIFSFGKCPFVADANAIKKFYKDGNTLPKPNECPFNVFQLMRECWKDELDHRKKPQEAMRDINRILYQVYNARQDHYYSVITPLCDDQLDNVSNKSEESLNFSSNLVSAPTLSTFDFDAEGSTSIELMLFDHNAPSWTPLVPIKSSPQVYQCFDNSVNSTTPKFEQTEHSSGYGGSSSIESEFKLDYDYKLILNGRIGEGFHSEVYRGELQHWYDLEDIQKVAVKKLKENTLTLDKADFDREISILRQLDHPNIVKIKGVIKDPRNPDAPHRCLVLEYIDHGSLTSYLKLNREKLSTLHLLKFALDIAKGMIYLGEKKIVHRDLSARNILVVNERHVKISDFGLAQCIGNKNHYSYKTERRLPVEWYAPESLELKIFSSKSEVWSYGVTMYEMFSFGLYPRLPVLQRCVNDISKALASGIRLERPADCPPYVYEEIMRECWQYEADKRPTFIEIYKIIYNLLYPDPEIDNEKSSMTLGLPIIYR